MQIVLCDSIEETGRRAANVFARQIAAGRSVLGLATGSSAQPLYDELVRRHRSGALNFGACSAFTLDEYVGMPREDPRSYRATIRSAFVDHVDLPVNPNTV